MVTDMKIMRSNYDKKHRCPNWSGPAFKGGVGDCPGGSLSRQMYGTLGEKRHAEWKFFVCYQCGTIVLPNILRNLDPSWWKFAAGRKKDRLLDKYEDWKYERQMRGFE